ncbi:MAG: type IV secretion system DNA-binding domain-containing protein, partial [Candidatus Falkowbacteria bacterium]|nr:type IV secretion system DNA-binding domain-containing protein [Candidatus Falkowbacteria bacterium]
MENNDITIFAETTFRNQNRKFGIKYDDRRRHMYLIGKTGMGKTTILENMIIEDIRAGRGVGVVDPHGDLAEKV